MWLNDFYDKKTYRGGKPQFKNAFNYWRAQLFNKVNKLYTWNNLPESIPQKEIETRLILWGKCGIVKAGAELLAVDIEMFGITNYYDEFKQFNYCTPLQNGMRTIGKDGVLVDNDTLRNPIIPIIDRYSMMLAHAEISFINALVNGRDAKTIVASSNQMAEEIRKYQNKLYDGANDVIVDRALIGAEFHENDHSPLNFVKSLYDVRNEILYAFYEDLGIKKNQQKRERLVADEVSADEVLLKLNILDMTDARKRAAEQINTMFGTNISVKCNVDYDGNGIADGKEGEPDEVKNTNVSE